MPKVSRRNSLTRGRSWPVNTADVKSALGDHADLTSIVWYDHRDDRYVRDTAWITWIPERSGGHSFAPDENPVVLWLVPVDDDDAPGVGDALRTVVLPEVAEWIGAAFDQDDEWQQLGHSRRWQVLGDSVTRSSHDESRRHHRRR